MNRNKFASLALTAAAVTAYSAITGKGIFNKIRFKKERDAIGRYVESNYPEAVYSPVQKTELGYAVVVRRKGSKSNIMIYATPTADGHYVFREVK